MFKDNMYSFMMSTISFLGSKTTLSQKNDGSLMLCKKPRQAELIIAKTNYLLVFINTSSGISTCMSTSLLSSIVTFPIPKTHYENKFIFATFEFELLMRSHIFVFNVKISKNF